MATSIAQKIGELARTYQQAVESVMSKLPDATKKALNRKLANGDVAWGLALILAGWRLPIARRDTDRDELARFLTAAGAREVVQQIAGLESQFPANFRTFLTSAEDGSLAAAGEYFAATISALGLVARTVLHSWLEKIDAPASGLASAVASLPSAGTTARGTEQGGPSQPRIASTVQKQASGDTAAGPKQPSGDSAPGLKQPQSDTGTPADSADPDQATFVGAYLISLGWKLADISRILVGPERAHQTAEQVFAKWAALHGSDREAVRSRLQQLHPDRVEPIVAGDIVPSAVRPANEPIDAEALYGLYRDLPPAQQGRLLLLLSMTPKGSQTPAVDDPTQVPSEVPVSPPTPRPSPTKEASAPKPTPAAPKPPKPPQAQPKSSEPTDVVIPIVKGGIELVSQLIKDALKESKAAPPKSGGGGDSGSSSFPPSGTDQPSGGDGRMTERSEYFPDGIDDADETEGGGDESGDSQPMQDFPPSDEVADPPLPDVMEA